MIAVERVERAAGEADEQAAIEAIDRDGGIWLGCDVVVPQLYRREAKAALDPLLSVHLDGRRLHIVPHGDTGRALALQLAPLADFETHDGRLEIGFDGAPAEPHPAIALLRRLLAAFDLRCPEFGFYGTLAFDYYRLSHGDAIPDDGRRRLVLMLPARVLLSGEGGARWVEFRFPGLAPQPARRRRSRPRASSASRTTCHPAAMPRRWRAASS